MLFVVLTATITICIAEGIPLVRNKLWKEFALLGFLLGIALLLVIVNRLNLPGPVALMGKLLDPIGKAIFEK